MEGSRRARRREEGKGEGGDEKRGEKEVKRRKGR